MVFPDSKHARILIVDDEPAVGRALARMLRNEFDVMLASSGDEAFALMSARPFDAVLSDLAMSDGSGPELYCQIRETLPGMETRMVFMTGDASSPKALAWTSGIGNPVLEKPVHMADLRAALASVMGHKAA